MQLNLPVSVTLILDTLQGLEAFQKWLAAEHCVLR